MVFYPAKAGLLDRLGRTALVYRFDGQPLLFPEMLLLGAVSSQRLDGHWHRLSYADREDLRYLSMGLMILYLTMGSSIVAIPLALGFHRLARGYRRAGVK